MAFQGRTDLNMWTARHISEFMHSHRMTGGVLVRNYRLSLVIGLSIYLYKVARYFIPRYSDNTLLSSLSISIIPVITNNHIRGIWYIPRQQWPTKQDPTIRSRMFEHPKYVEFSPIPQYNSLTNLDIILHPRARNPIRYCYTIAGNHNPEAVPATQVARFDTSEPNYGVPYVPIFRRGRTSNNVREIYFINHYGIACYDS